MTIQSHYKECKIKEHIGMEMLEPLRPVWEQWQNHPNADFDFYATVIKSRPNVVSPVAFTVFDENAPVALAVCRLEKAKLPLSFGYMEIPGIKMLQLTVVYGGIMGTWDEIKAKLFLDHLRDWMRRDRVDAVHFTAMRHDHPIYDAVHKFTPSLLRNFVLKNNPHWWTDIPGSEEVCPIKMKGRHRTQLKNKERKLSDYCGGNTLAKRYQASEEVASFCTDAEKIAQTTYLRGLGKGFYDNEEMRNRLDLAARRGWMRGYILYANGRPCAFWLGTMYQTVLYLDYTGYDSELKEFTPGHILFLKMIEQLRETEEIHGIDFGFGDADYKKRFGDRNWEESDLYLFNATPSMVLANCALKATEFARSVAEKAMKRLSLFASIKKQWRLSAKKSAGDHDGSDAYDA
jgi:hypothetical protein